MHKCALALLVVSTLLLPGGLRACDCDDDTPVVFVHFKDGIAPNGPVIGDPGYAVTVEGGCPCSEKYSYRDYGPALVKPPPVTPPPKRPTS